MPDTAVDEYQPRMNKWDNKLKNLMILAKNKCRTYKNDDLEWSPTVKMWLKRRWILGRVQRFIATKRVCSLNRYKNLKRVWWPRSVHRWNVCTKQYRIAVPGDHLEASRDIMR